MNSRYKSVGESSLVGCRELNRRVIESPVLQTTLRGKYPNPLRYQKDYMVIVERLV
jgi:hypothetical protein